MFDWMQPNVFFSVCLTPVAAVLHPVLGLECLLFPKRPLTSAAPWQGEALATRSGVRTPATLMQISCHNLKRSSDQRSALLCVGVWYRNFYFISSCQGMLGGREGGEKDRGKENEWERRALCIQFIRWIEAKKLVTCWVFLFVIGMCLHFANG